MHLQNFQRVACGILGDQILDFGTGESDISLAKQGRDIVAGDVGQRILPVLQLSESLRSQAKLRLGTEMGDELQSEFGAKAMNRSTHPDPSSVPA